IQATIIAASAKQGRVLGTISRENEGCIQPLKGAVRKGGTTAFQQGRLCVSALLLRNTKLLQDCLGPLNGFPIVGETWRFGNSKRINGLAIILRIEAA